MLQPHANASIRLSLIYLFLFLVLSDSLCLAQGNNKLDAANLEETMRDPWQYKNADYIKDWLVLGPFPASSPGKIDTDFLAKFGGEADSKPRAGESIVLEEGGVLKWLKHQSAQPAIDLKKIFDGQKTENVVAYAYTKIHRSKSGSLYLLLGSDDGVKVWLNGKEIHRKLVRRALKLDQDFVVAEMNAGDNHLLVKVQQGCGGWESAVRKNEIDENVLLVSDRISFSISEIDTAKKTIAIKSSARIEYSPIELSVNVHMYTSGMETVLQNDILRGDSIVADYGKWPEGPYEIKFSYYTLSGLHQTQYLSWYKGDILAAARELVQSSPGNNAKTPQELIHKMLADMVLDRSGGDLEKPDRENFDLLHSPLMEFAELKAGNRVHSNGFVRLAYHDEIDGTPQFCRVYLPSDYDSEKQWPLIAWLHGYSPENPEYINFSIASKRHDPIADSYHVIFIEPHGRGNTSYLGMGDRDVLRGIELAKANFNVDEDRVYLTGESMGGGGTWHVGSRHPEIFAALAPVYGGWDHHVWMDRGRQNEMTDKEHFVHDINDFSVQLESLLNTSVLVLHGENDAIVDVNFSRYMVRMLQRWAYDVRYIEVPGKGHENLGMDHIIYPWLLEQERVKNPKKVRVRAGELRNASAHWVEILLNERPWEGMNVDAEILANNIIRVDSDNVLKLKISPPQEFINAHERLNVVWNGRITTFENPQEYILLENKKTRPPTLQKTPGLAGPIKDFINTPFAMVIGTTSKDSLMQRIINQKADAIIASWKDWQNFEPRVFKDVEITKQDIQKYSLYLLGGIEENKVSKMLWSELPIKISNDMVGIFGQTYQAKDAVVDIVYPNPLNSDRYVRLVLPTSSKGMYFFDPELDNLKDNDFYIADGKIPNSRAGFPQGKITLASGRFNYNWELDKAYLQMGNPELRANCLTTIIHDDFTTSIRGAIVVSPDLLKSYVGLYYFEARNFRLQVMMENGKFLGQGPDGRAMEMHALSETDFIVPELDIQLSFVRDEASSEAILIIYQQDSEMEGKKIKSVHHEK